jgi:ParB family transcriptional regulator, chromosome partitioning protein
MSRNDQRKALGKGLYSLRPSRNAPAPPPAPVPVAPVAGLPRDGDVVWIPIDRVKPNANQPRRDFDPAAMLELTQSIERDGVIQPIIVRHMDGGDYQIIAGERRWRAAKSAGILEIAAIPRTADDHRALELAIIENIQREDLNPIELARGFQRMASELGLSHDQIGEKTGKDRATVTNTIRLLQLPEDLQELIATKKLSPGHARALLKISDPQRQREIAERCVAEGWSVRQIENYTKSPESGSAPSPRTKSEPPPQDPNVKAAITEMEDKLATRVRIIEKGRDKGLIEIEYYSADDLDRIYNIIVGAPS